MVLPDKLQFTVSFPTDQGFFGRQCKSPECGRHFKVHMDSIKPQMHCPYCGVEFPDDQLWTKDQLRYMHRTIEHEVMPIIQQEFTGMLRDALQGSKGISLKSRRPIIRPRPQPSVERQVDSELVCPECQTQFQVDGIFGYCPGCRVENLRLYDANLQIIKRETASSTNPARVETRL